MLALLLVHALAALLAPLLVRVLGRSAFLLLALAPLAALVWTALHWGQELRAEVAWAPSIDLSVTLRFDSLAQVMAVLVSGVGALVLVYCARYFTDGEPRLGRFAAYLTAFAGTMLLLVVSDNMLLLYVAWELTTVLSFLLVGHYNEQATSRRAATQALLVTTTGGLAMLVGIVVLGRLAGSYLLSDVVERAPHGWLAGVAVALVLVGALSKSAIIPMHFWLPGAMAAPTPVSAYLHAAAMVKAGVFLLARLAPAYADSAPWRPVVITLGLVSMLVAGWRALREYDLKLVLAFGTVSQLGFLVVLVGSGSRDVALAGLAMVVAHALFKSTLFLTVGVIDHASGTRDLRDLAGLGRRHPVLAAAGGAAALSMAGIPPFIGFVGKEAAFETLLHDGIPTTAGVPAAVWSVTALVGVVLGSVLTVAYSLRFVWGAFGAKGDSRPSRAVREMHAPGWLFQAPPVVLAVLSLAAGLAAPLLDDLLAPYADTLPPAPGVEETYHLAVWHGLGVPVWLSLFCIVGGLVLFRYTDQVIRLQFASPALGNADRVYDGSLRLADTLSLRFTQLTQRGKLSVNLATIVLTLAVVPGVALLVGDRPALSVRLWDSPGQAVVLALATVAAVAAVVVRGRLSAVLLVGATGYAAAVVFALHGAPDLALTQVLVETLTLVMFVLVLRKLPPRIAQRKPVARRSLRVLLAVSVSLVLTTLAAFAVNARSTTPISVLFAEAAYGRGEGKNVVNVTLVDIRAWDTIGEISVLLVAATGVASLVFRHRRFGSAPRVTDAQLANAPDSAREGGTTWLRGGELVDPELRSLVLEVAARLVFPTIMVLSVYFLFSGHNAPGGGFAGGLTAGLALVVRYLAGGRYELGETVPVDVGAILGVGLLLAGGTAAASIALGAPVLSSAVLEVTLPVLGDVKLVTALFFDVGVYLIVVGLVLDVLRSLGAGLDATDEGEDADDANPTLADAGTDTSPAIREGYRA
ncbi:Na+/H+ antiporter subunit A [Rhodococcus aerolatus]